MRSPSKKKFIVTIKDATLENEYIDMVIFCILLILVAYFRVITQITVQIIRIIMFLVSKLQYRCKVFMFTLSRECLLARELPKYYQAYPFVVIYVSIIARDYIHSCVWQ